MEFPVAGDLSGLAGQDVLGGWHHMTRQAFFYWRSVHPKAGLPGRQHIDPLDIPELLPGLWLLDIQPRPFRLRYRLVGTGIVQAYGREVTGLWLDEAHPQLVEDSAYLARYRAVAGGGAPSWRRGPPRFAECPAYLEVENIILPLAADGQNVDMLMAHSVFWPRS